MEKAFLDFQKHQADEKRADRQREKEEALRMRRLAEHAAEEAKVCLVHFAFLVCIKIKLWFLIITEIT